MAAANRFIIENTPDGKIKQVSVGGFDKATHHDADDILEMISELACGPSIVRKNVAKPNENKQTNIVQH